MAADKKPELKTEPKDDDDDLGSGTPRTPAGIPNKKKRENTFHREIYIQDMPKCSDVEFHGLMQPPTIVYFLIA